MTSKLFLLRHAKSSWDDPDLSDRDRPLAKRGKKAGALLRDYFRAEGVRPDLALVSSARRTRETFAALELDPAPPAQILPELYHAAPETILDAIRAAPETAGVVLVVGHNPGLENFARMLADDRTEAPETFPTGALAQFEIDRPWAELEAGCGKLVRFVTPKTLGRARTKD